MISETLRRRIVRALVPSYLVMITGIPLVAVTIPILVAGTVMARSALMVLAPIEFTLLYALTCGLLSLITRRALVPGKFRRDLGDKIYGPRRLYSLCWTSLYYCSPVYHAVLSVPALKWITFRLFGYRGSLDVVLYPDTWIRDLPLLDIAPEAYLSNRATIGTNICLQSGDLLVAPIAIGRGSMVGHLSMLAPGVVIGKSVEVSVGVGVGIKSRIGDRSKIGPCCVIEHGVMIGADCDIGASSYIGSKVTIADGIYVPPGSVVPRRVSLRSMEDVRSLCQSAHSSQPQTTNDIDVAGVDQARLRDAVTRPGVNHGPGPGMTYGLGLPE
jgi:NDP-sugar pyrophosphorylase family protein